MESLRYSCAETRNFLSPQRKDSGVCIIVRLKRIALPLARESEVHPPTAPTLPGAIFFLEVPDRVDGVAVDSHFEVEVRSGGEA